MASILISTADLERAAQLQSAFEPEDSVRFVSGPHEAREALREGEGTDSALILTGAVQEPDARGLISALLSDGLGMPIIALFDEGEAVTPSLIAELGVDEHFVKPIDPFDVALVVRRLIRQKLLQNEIGIVGNSEAIREVVERVAQIAPVGSTVLITGESGTGKELIARGLHRLSPRRGKPFIAVNIAALPETLLESELFGHEKGAFTGASSLRKGMFELANGGTIFLDEVAEMHSGPQTRLLRVLEQREFMRVGGGNSIKVDVRVIAATNRVLREAVGLNEFRRDLYYRLNVLHIHMPPLRERREDIPLLVHEFIRELSEEHQRDFKGIELDAMDILVRYDWPGNVRELRNLIESMVVLAPGTTIRPRDIPPEVRRGADHVLLPRREIASPPVRQAEGVSATDGTPALMAEMDVIFRTLVELKFDVDDLRREFEAYRRRHPELVRPREAAVVGAQSVSRSVHVEPVEGIQITSSEGTGAPASEDSRQDEDLITFRLGMTMEELERAAIVATLESVDGNRRRASEELGIGERTLYRKIKEYGIDA